MRNIPQNIPAINADQIVSLSVTVHAIPYAPMIFRKCFSASALCNMTPIGNTLVGLPLMCVWRNINPTANGTHTVLSVSMILMTPCITFCAAQAMIACIFFSVILPNMFM